MSDTKQGWEQVTVGALGRDKIERLQVDSGWLYRNASCAEGGMTFVPFPQLCGTDHPQSFTAQGPHGV